MLSTFMVIVRYTLLFIAIKYGKTLLRMINQEYERKFNYKFTSKKNIIRPFLASIFITIGFYTSLFSYSQYTLLLTGIGLIAYEVYDVYKKTDLKYAMISAFIYLFMVIFFLCLGLFILFIFIFMAVAYEYKHKKEEIYIYCNPKIKLEDLK